MTEIPLVGGSVSGVVVRIGDTALFPHFGFSAA